MPTAHRHRLSPKIRVVALLDRRVEGVHVDMDDLALGGIGHGKILLSYRPFLSLAVARSIGWSSVWQ
jgi:hypothetical protein